MPFGHGVAPIGLPPTIDGMLLSRLGSMRRPSAPIVPFGHGVAPIGTWVAMPGLTPVGVGSGVGVCAITL